MPEYDSPLRGLQSWYARQCDGEWEHRYGPSIETVDNPGWVLTVPLAGTDLADRPFAERRENYEHPEDWLTCQRADDCFVAVGGPHRLERMIEIFLQWAETPRPGE